MRWCCQPSPRAVVLVALAMCRGFLCCYGVGPCCFSYSCAFGALCEPLCGAGCEVDGPEEQDHQSVSTLTLALMSRHRASPTFSVLML